MKKRYKWLDIAKGICIILMVIGHSSIPSWLTCFIFAFHMPLFFIASGYSTSWGNRTFCIFLQKKVKNLLVPFLFYSALILFVKFAIGELDFYHWLKHGWGGYALWFIPVIFFSSLLMFLINLIKIKRIKVMLLLFLVLIGYFLSYIDFCLPWTISSIPYTTFLIAIGNYLKSFPMIIEKPKYTILLFLFCITFAISQFVTMDLCSNSIIPLFPLTISAISGTVMIFILSRYIEIKGGLPLRLLEAIGKETYIIVAFSQIIIVIVNKYITHAVLIKYSILVLVLMLLCYFKNLLKSVKNEIFYNSLHS